VKIKVRHLIERQMRRLEQKVRNGMGGDRRGGGWEEGDILRSSVLR
jgi:hypothetical protein